MILLLFGPAASGKTTAGKHINKKLSKIGNKSTFINDAKYFKRLIPIIDPVKKHHRRTRDGGYDFFNNYILDKTTEYIFTEIIGTCDNKNFIVEMARGKKYNSTNSCYRNTWSIIPSKFKKNISVIYIYASLKKRINANLDRRSKGEHFCSWRGMKDYQEDDFDQFIEKNSDVKYVKIKNHFNSLKEYKNDVNKGLATLGVF